MHKRLQIDLSLQGHNQTSHVQQINILILKTIPWANSVDFDMIGLPYYGAFDIRLCQIPHICLMEREWGNTLIGG